MRSLLITGDDGSERRVALPDRTVRIGRSPENDVVLSGADQGVSRAHAELRYSNGEWTLVDLQSQNGTWVNGERIVRAVVPAGGEVAIGLYRLRLEPAGVSDVVDIPLRPVRPAAAVRGAGRAADSQGPAPQAGGRSPMLLVGGGVLIGFLALGLARFFTPAATPGAVPAATESRPTPPTGVTEPEGAAVPLMGVPAEASSTARPPDAAERSRPATPPGVNRLAASEAFASGRNLDSAGDWLGALRKFDQARQFDASLPGIDRAVKQVWDKLRVAGGEALQRARDDEANGRIDDALREYDKAALWLPPDDPNRQAAHARAEALRTGGK